MLNISVNFKVTKKVEHILENSLDFQSLLMHFMLFIYYL